MLQSVDECMVGDCQIGEERLSRAYYSLITTVRNHQQHTHDAFTMLSRCFHDAFTFRTSAPVN